MSPPARQIAAVLRRLVESLSADAWRAEIKPYGEGYVALTPDGVRKHFVQDIQRMKPTSCLPRRGRWRLKCFGDKISTAAWRSKPSWYIVAAPRRNHSPEVERDSAKRMRAKTSSSKSSHVPMLSQPAAVAEFIASAAASL